MDNSKYKNQKGIKIKKENVLRGSFLSYGKNLKPWRGVTNFVVLHNILGCQIY